jgi:hypothetical protein
MKYTAGLSLMKALGCRPRGEALDSLNALSGADSAGERMALQACDRGRPASRALSCRAGVRDVEPAERHCADIRKRISE